jgi:2,3-bisphosphoglycerate-independent phosphoglycerate mutase
VKPTVLIILDGWGQRLDQTHNAIRLAHSPHYDSWLQEYPVTELLTHGPAVGLTEGVMGNSEVGHTNIGAGRIVHQTLSRIAADIQNKAFFKNPELLTAIRTAKEKQSALHLMGLLSDAGVHSDQSHLEALLELAKQEGLSRVFVHPFMDGRDTSPRSGTTYLKRLQTYLERIEIGSIASICGRYYGMDRDQRWERTAMAYAALRGTGTPSGNDPMATLEAWYQHGDPQPGFGDEFMPPTTFIDRVTRAPIGTLQDDDVVIHVNFRPDRARQLTQALTDDTFTEFARENPPKLGHYTCMAPYGEAFDLPVAYTKEKLSKILPELIADQGIKQFRCAETEKFAHVTYFLNGGDEKVFPGEDRKLIPSNREIATYDLAPEMRAREVTTEVLAALASEQYGLFVINFANPDMVGHTGKEAAAVKAVETLDECLGKLVETVLDKAGVVLITADHGNCEEMVDSQGHPHTQHTLNPVPCLVIGSEIKDLKLKPGRLCDVAPTILQLMGLEQPKEMTGESLII